MDGDSQLSLQELARYINRRIREHIEASIRNNPILFSQIDQSPRNGLVTWDEYYIYFLKSLGYDDAFIRQVDRKRNSNLDRKTKELLMRDKALWNEAARSDSYTLTLDEFLAFKHPGKIFFTFLFLLCPVGSAQPVGVRKSNFIDFSEVSLFKLVF